MKREIAEELSELKTQSEQLSADNERWK